MFINLCDAEVEPLQMNTSHLLLIGSFESSRNSKQSFVNYRCIIKSILTFRETSKKICVYLINATRSAMYTEMERKIFEMQNRNKYFYL